MPGMLQGDSITDDQRDAVQDLWENGTISDTDIQSDQELREVCRDLAKRSLYFLSKGVLGYKDLEKDVHLPYAKFIQDTSNKRTLDLMPRGTYKTSIGTIGFSIQQALIDPDIFILIANQTASNAERMLLEIESHFDGSNPMMNWLFPEYIKPGDRYKPWSSSKMTVPCRTLSRGTPTITTIGVGGKVESQHFHIIINDDLIGRAAQESQIVMLDAISWHDYSVSLFVRPAEGIERCHGTRWSLSDLYSILLKDPAYTYYIREAVNRDTGEPLFSTILPLEELRKIREKNFAHYMSQYMNDPHNEEALDFKNDWMHYYNLIETPEGPACQMNGELFYVHDMYVVMAVDPAGSGDMDNNLVRNLGRGRAIKSNNAVGIAGIHRSGFVFLLDMWVGRGKGDNPELEVALQMYKLYMAWKGYLSKGVVEAYGAQRALITVFNMVCRSNGEYFHMEEVGRGDSRKKHVRIRSYIGPIAQDKRLCVRRSHDKFIQEYSDFPQSTDFDTLDMMAWAISVLIKRQPLSDEEKKIVRGQIRKQQALRLRYAGKAGY